MPREIVALDVESFYSDEVSISTMGVVNYLHNTDIYLVSLASSAGWKFTGECKDAPWDKLQGADLVSHNAGFDAYAWHALKQKGVIPATIQNNSWSCSSDMGSYMGFPRSLKNVMASQYDVPVNKDTRDKMKGKRWADMPEEFKQEVIQYAQADADHCLRIWQDHSHKWPERENALSRHTRVMSWQGIPIDEPALDKAIDTLYFRKEDALDKIPWGRSEPKPLSLNILGEWCKSQGIPSPKSTAKDSEDFELWAAEYGNQSPVVSAMSELRSVNVFLERAIGTKARIHEGCCSSELLYYGAGNTGRWSGSGGVNWQNLPRKEMYGVDFRGLVKSPEGYMLVVADLAQIEPRVMAVLSQDKAMVQLLREIPDLYEAQAVAWKWWEKGKPGFRETPLRSKAKITNLGLGFGMWVDGFMASTGLKNRSEAEEIVLGWRRANKPIVSCWENLDKLLARMVGQDLEFELESGRNLLYRDVRRTGSKNGRPQMIATIVKNGKYFNRKIWGSAFWQNIIQATARDIFAEAILRIARAGIRIVLHVHDEVVCLVRNDQLKDAVETIREAMTTPPDWLPGIPLGTSIETMERYAK